MSNTPEITDADVIRFLRTAFQGVGATHIVVGVYGDIHHFILGRPAREGEDISHDSLATAMRMFVEAKKTPAMVAAELRVKAAKLLAEADALAPQATT